MRWMKLMIGQMYPTRLHMNKSGQDTSRVMVSDKPDIPFYLALIFWVKLGFMSFGGPAGQISIMHDELVERRRWISNKRFLHALNYTMLLPGPEAQQLATYIGWLMHGVRGGIVAGVLFVLPSFFILSILAWLYLEFGDVPIVQGILYGVKPAVVAIVLFAAYRIGKNVLNNPVLWVLAALAFVSIALLKIPFPYIVLGAGLIGWLLSRYRKGWFEMAEHHSSAENTIVDAVIGDQTPPPPHARFSWPRTFIFAGIGLFIFVGLFGLLLLLYGWQSVFSQMAWFFTKAALVTFGGAYAVLPYVHQGGVEVYGWLSSSQMIDGLALGETTPGPLIMIVAFVGFVGGWTAEMANPIIAAWIAAAIATVFTFLPSFLFILVGGPLVEKTRDEISFTAPLTAITAAVVGVILNLALFFAIHTFWPSELGQSTQWMAIVLTVLAFITLLGQKIGVIPIIIVSALFGLIYQSVI